MKIENIDLSLHNSKCESCGFTAFVHEGNVELPLKNRPAMLVLPGGGYGMTSEREGEPVALEFYNRGYNTFVLKYSVAPKRYPVSLVQAATAIDYIKKHAKELCVMPGGVFAIGFSAGGHLAGSLANADKSGVEEIKKLECKLDGVVLAYPVIFDNGHQGSYENLLGSNYAEMVKEDKYKWLNLHTAVTKSSPPTFIWCTADDSCVSANNSILYASACSANNVKFELHVYASGQHGLSLADSRVYSDVQVIEPDVSDWVKYSFRFLNGLIKA